jgi:hypothetical protein
MLTSWRMTRIAYGLIPLLLAAAAWAQPLLFLAAEDVIEGTI